MSAIYPVLNGIVSDAIGGLATDRPAQINVTVRNPKTNAWEIKTRIRAVISASRPEGKSRQASLIFIRLNVPQNAGRKRTAPIIDGDTVPTDSSPFLIVPDAT